MLVLRSCQIIDIHLFKKNRKRFLDKIKNLFKSTLHNRPHQHHHTIDQLHFSDSDANKSNSVPQSGKPIERIKPID